MRVAAVHYEGGFAANQLALTPPEVVVYSDGTVVVSATKRSTLPPAVLTSLLSTVRKDLDGLPATVNPANGRTIPDIPTTVLGIRKADGSYQTVRASGLQQLGQEGGYPAPLYDAFTRLHGLTTAPSTPYSASGVRYQLQCPAAATTTPQPWPSAIPQPINGDGPSCTEIHLGGGATVAAVRTACVPLVQTDPQAKPAVPYRSDKGVRTCQWRYALPDENNS